jgi:hypothetical protein
MWLNDCDFPAAIDLVSAEVGGGGTVTSWDLPSPPAAAKPDNARPKKVHTSAEQALLAMAWALANDNVITSKRMPDQAWRYHHADGSDAGAVGRWETDKGKKTYRQVCCVSNNGWVSGGMTAPRPLYRLPDLIDAEKVYVCEGEKAADALAGLGLAATTPSQGAQSPHLTDWRRLHGKEVVIVPDNDQTGYEFGVQVSELIARANDIRSTIIDWPTTWPDCPDKGDAADWVAAHPDADPADLKPKPPAPLIVPVGRRAAKDNEQPSDKIPDEVFENLTGILKLTYDHIMQTALYPLREITLAAAISLVSVICGRKISDEWGSRSNLYSLCIAPTASGKDYPRKVVQDLLYQSGGGALCGPEDLASAQGLSSLLVLQPASLLMLDEFGKMLGGMLNANAAPHLSALAGDFLKLYSASDRTWTGRAYADSTRTPVIPSPSLTIMGSSTASTVWSNVSSTQIHDGLLGRCHLYSQDGYVHLASTSQDLRKTPFPEKLIEDIKFWVAEEPESVDMLTGSPVPNIISHTSEAWQRHMQHADAISHRRVGEDPLRAAIWSRATEGAGKLALISAASRRSNQVEIEDVEFSITLQNSMSRKLIRNVMQNMSDTPAERQKNKLLDLIRSKNRWTWYQLARKTQWIKDTRERESLIKDLADAGRVEVWKEEGSKTRYISITTDQEEEEEENDYR